jgi:hypothetical protein
LPPADYPTHSLRQGSRRWPIQFPIRLAVRREISRRMPGGTVCDWPVEGDRRRDPKWGLTAGRYRHTIHDKAMKVRILHYESAWEDVT